MRLLLICSDIYFQKKWRKKREYFTYPPQKMRDAVRDVLNGMLDIVYSALEHKVPEMTLRDHVR